MFEPIPSDLCCFGYILSPEVNKVFLPEFNKVSFEPVSNIACSSNRPLVSVYEPVGYVLGDKVDKVFFPEVDEIFLPEIYKVSCEPFANIFKC